MAELLDGTICVAREVTGIVSHHGYILALSHLVLAQPEIATQRDGIFAANETACLYQNHIGQWNQRRVLGDGG